jgi:cytochrome d ubiquinol oxidase subunit II
MINFWVSVLAMSILLYVLLDGFDLGIGILYGFARDDRYRRTLMSAVAPVWDGNETWLIVSGVVLWGAFPIVYATLFSAFYLPLLFMLAGLILRGVSFEFRGEARHLPWVWDLGFAGGSFVAAFMQGTMVGALVQGLPLVHGNYAGGEFSWLSPFSVLAGGGLCLGYALLGACWLVRKSAGDVQASAFRLIPALSLFSLAVLAAVFLFALTENLRVLDRWIERPFLFAFPLIGVVSGIALVWSVRRRREQAPFYLVAATFAAAFSTFALSFLPYMIPFSITIEDAAAPHSTLAFMFWGEGLFVLPLMLLYTAISYRVFRGKIGSNFRGYHSFQLDTPETR